MAISVVINASNLGSALASLERSLKDRRVIHRQIGAQFFSWVQRNFDSEGGLRPEPWAPLAPSTVLEKARGGWSPKKLVRTGNLRNSFLPFSDEDQAGVGARASFGVDYAQVHEEGSDDGRVPARPMLPPDDVAMGYVTRIYERFVVDSRGKAGL